MNLTLHTKPRVRTGREGRLPYTLLYTRAIPKVGPTTSSFPILLYTFMLNACGRFELVKSPGAINLTYINQSIN